MHTLTVRAGFTLIEVMVAIVILAVGLASLFTSEAGAVRIAQRARTTTIASLLARCKMGEVEERVAKEGFPADQIDGRDECCEGGEHDGFRCEWKVERIVLPEISEMGNTGGTGGTGGGGKLAGGLTGGKNEMGSTLMPGAPPSAGERSRPLPGAFANLSDAGTSEAGILGSVVTSFGESSGGGDPISAMVMELTFPVMKPVIEEGVRRATVTVNWKEGDREQTFDIVQYLVNEMPLLPSESQVENALTGGGTGGSSSPGSSSAPGGSTTSPSSTQPASGARR